MITLADAKRVNDTVRQKFKNGLKSSNKLYYDANDVRDSIDIEEAITFAKRETAPVKTFVRAVFAPQSGLIIASMRNGLERRERDRRERGRLPLKKSEEAEFFEELVGNCAGNCNEMARSAALCLPLTDNSQVKCFGSLNPSFGAISETTDHVFCIVRPSKTSFRKYRVSDLKFEPVQDWIVIDPWLNVCCPACEYPEKAERQLLKWGKEGKRICTKGPDQEWKLYRADGTYKNRFLNSMITIKPYT